MANELKKITALPSGTPADTDVVPFVDLATNTTKKALKSELKGEQGNAATVDAGTTTTLAAGESATVTNVGTTAAAIFNFAIPQGIQGLTGADGACVESVSFVGNDMVFTLDDDSTVTLTNAKVTLKGDKGDTGAKITSAEFVGDDLVFTLDDDSTVTITGAKTALKGDTGNAGADGDDGAAATITVGTVTTVANNVPASVTNVGTSAAAIFDFEIPKGLDGTGSGDVVAPATNTDSYIPQWDGANSKTLKDGLAVPDGGLAGLTALGGKQDALGFTPENVANKRTSFQTTPTDTAYPSEKLVKDSLDGKQATLVSGTNIKTINGETLLGSTDIVISGGGSSLWTEFSGTRTSNTTITVSGDVTAIFKKGMVVKWTDGTTHVGMVSIPSTESGGTTTITIIGDVCSADATDFSYCLLPVETMNFAVAGTIGATATDVGNAQYARMPYRVLGADLQVGTVASTSGTTTVDINKGGTTFMTTKATLAYNVASSPTPFTADDDTSLALGDKVTIDINGVTSTTFPVDLYVQLYVMPSRFLTLS